jgi:hypothetical protein
LKLNAGLPWKKQHSTRIGLKFKEETSKVLHLEHPHHQIVTYKQKKEQSTTVVILTLFSFLEVYMCYFLKKKA